MEARGGRRGSKGPQVFGVRGSAWCFSPALREEAAYFAVCQAPNASNQSLSLPD